MVINKKAQVVKIISTLQVLLLVMVLLGVYLSMAYFMSKTYFLSKGETNIVSQNGYFVLPEESLLLKEISFKLKDKTENLLVIDPLLKYLDYRGTKERNTLEVSLEDLLKEEASKNKFLENKKVCLIFVGSDSNKRPSFRNGYSDGILIEFENGKASNVNNPGYLGNYFSSSGVQAQIITIPFENSFGKDKYYLDYYYGECPERVN